MRFDATGELLEILEPLVQDPLQDREVHLQLAMHQDIAQSRDRAQVRERLAQRGQMPPDDLGIGRNGGGGTHAAILTGERQPKRFRPGRRRSS